MPASIAFFVSPIDSPKSAASARSSVPSCSWPARGSAEAIKGCRERARVHRRSPADVAFECRRRAAAAPTHPRSGTARSGRPFAAALRAVRRAAAGHERGRADGGRLSRRRRGGGLRAAPRVRQSPRRSVPGREPSRLRLLEGDRGLLLGHLRVAQWAGSLELLHIRRLASASSARRLNHHSSHTGETSSGRPLLMIPSTAVLKSCAGDRAGRHQPGQARAAELRAAPLPRRGTTLPSARGQSARDQAQSTSPRRHLGVAMGAAIPMCGGCRLGATGDERADGVTTDSRRTQTILGCGASRPGAALIPPAASSADSTGLRGWSCRTPGSFLPILANFHFARIEPGTRLPLPPRRT